MISAAAITTKGEKMVMEDKGLLTIESAGQGMPVFEAYGLLLASVLLGSNGKPPRVVAVTAAQPGGGASTVSANLAIMMARTGRPTVLVDACLRAPVLHAVLSVPRAPGLAEVLMGRKALQDVIVQTRIPHLSLVPSGRSEVPAQALVSQPALGDVFRALRERFDLVVVDTPAVPLYPDTLHIGKHVDGLLQVVSSQGVSLRDHQEARRLLDMVGVRVIGAVLNRVSPRARGAAAGEF